MVLADTVLGAGGCILRKIPYFKGLGRVYRFFNKIMLSAGASPLVKMQMKDKTHVKIDLRSNTEMNAFYTGTYDDELIELVRLMFDLNSTFVDVGANIGFYSIAISKSIVSSGGSGKVIAFEPFRGNYARLLENLKLNNFQLVCNAYSFGLSSKSSTSFITLREDFVSGSGTGNAAIPTSDDFDKNFDQVEIKLKKLDDIWSEDICPNNRLDLIKVDIEGHEDFFLQGAQETINKYRPTILMEVNKPYYKSRGVDLNDTFMPLIPNNYLIYRRNSRFGWVSVEGLNDCSTIDNVFLVPQEKIGLNKYQTFK